MEEKNEHAKTTSASGDGDGKGADGADVQNDEAASEREMIRRALDGDRDAKTQIVLEHRDNVYNLALKLTGDPHEAECVLQDAFLSVFEKLDRFRGESKLGTWIHRVTTNEALMRMRRRKGKYHVPIAEGVSEEDEDRPTGAEVLESLERDPLSLTLNEELKGKLSEAIAGLPPNLRTAFVLKDLEGLSMAEIGERLDKTVPAVKADLHRARVKLRAKLAEFVEGYRDGPKG